jgi:valyl-tRNA synthetase
MPFITEEIWHALYDQRAPAASIALTRFPTGRELKQEKEDSPAQSGILEQVQILREFMSDVLNRRAELKLDQKQRVPVRVFTTERSARRVIEWNQELIRRRANVESIDFAVETLSNIPGVQRRNAYEVAVIYEKKIDVAAERERLSKERAKLESELGNAKRQLGNESFLAKAPANVVEGLRRRVTELEQLLSKVRLALDELEKGGTSLNGSHG